jgi:hypothetical protein
MQRSLAIALVVIASACSSKKEPPSPAAGSGSASAPASGSASETCNDADVQTQIDASMAASLAYLVALEKKIATWPQDCEAAKQDLIALEPDAKKFMDAMAAFSTWAQALSESCRQRVGVLGETSTTAAEIEIRTPAIEAKVTPMLERCQAHPGFNDAARNGLRLMRRKKS